MSLSLWDCWVRAEKGQICTQHDFELKRFFPKIRELVKKYNIKYEPEQLIPTDEALIDNTFKAGVELLASVGVLCTDTDRLIEFTEEEIYAEIKNTPSVVYIGEGKEATTIIHRDIEDERMPTACVGPVCVPISDDIASIAYEAYASEPAVEALYPGTLTELRGMPVKAGSAFEMHAEKIEMTRARDACRRAERPGLCLWGSSYAAPITTVGACHPEWGYKKGDIIHCYLMPNLKTDYDSFCRAEHYNIYGVNIWSMGTTFVGGLAGGPEGAAIASVAEALASRILYKADVIALWCPDAMYAPGMAARKPVWASSLGLAAMAKHTPFPMQTWSPYQAYAGPCTEMYLYEIAGSSFPLIVCGAHPGHGGGRQGNQLDYFGGPLDSRFVRDVSYAATKANREKANDMLNKVMSKYENHIEAKNPPIGKRFQECNDLITLQPTQEYVDIYNKVKDELSRIGFEFDK
jgi:methylamine--corrinoid protein Co-methyltransferase